MATHFTEDEAETQEVGSELFRFTQHVCAEQGETQSLSEIALHYLRRNILSDLVTAQDPRAGIRRTKTNHLPSEDVRGPSGRCHRESEAAMHPLAGERPMCLPP